jgi:phosphomannomutase
MPPGRVIAAESPGGRVLVGYDTRFEAGRFSPGRREVLAAHGLEVGCVGSLRAHAWLCWAVGTTGAVAGSDHLASHNPARTWVSS